MKKFLMAVTAALAMSSVAFAQDNSTNWYNPDISAKEQLQTIQNKIVDNSKIVAKLGPEWAIETAKVKRLEILLANAKANAAAIESTINGVVAKQNILSSQAAELVTQLSIQMDPEEFETYRQTNVMPAVTAMTTLRDVSVGFVLQIEQYSVQFAGDPTVQNGESHVALSKYETKEYKKMLKSLNLE